jgi:hypothetical protein
VALGSTQHLTGISSIFLGGKGRPARKADLTGADCLEDVRTSTSHNPVGVHGHRFTSDTISANMAAVRNLVVTSRSTSDSGRRPQWYFKFVKFC